MSYTSDYNSRPAITVDDYGDALSTHRDSLDATRSLANRTPFYASSSSSSTEMNAHLADRASQNPALIYPLAANKSNPSVCSTATATPIPSRTASPLYMQDDTASTCSSDTDDENELEARLLPDTHRRSFSLANAPRWWTGGSSRRRRRDVFERGTWRWAFRKYILPFIPKTPLTILFTLLLLTAFAISLTHLIIYLCNPDKQPLPWRGYCTIPNYSTEPPPSNLGPYDSFPIAPPNGTFEPASFPPDNLETLSPAGVFVGVFSMDTGFERRMLIRSTYASHPRSRNGAGGGDGGVGTSRTVVRFVMGKPRKEWERRIQLEQETYNDIVILPIKENMNDGKTQAYFQWAATGAWVPPLYFDNYTTVPHNLSYANRTIPAPRLAHHDPIHAHQDKLTGSPKPWVRPDFIIKADDDSFVMLAELEAHLRVELHGKALPRQYATPSTPLLIAPPATPGQSTIYHPPNDDPLIYWGYLVKNRFMAGELYALSHSLVEWIANDPTVRDHVRGAEDQVTAFWIKWHPRAQDVRWVRERCWIYDHPKSGTVYARGFLFPSEAERVQKEIMGDIERWNKAKADALRTQSDSDSYVEVFGPGAAIPPSWVRSTVTTFHVRYTPPVPDLPLNYSVEALVEGSEMSRLTKRNATMADMAWRTREGRARRYQGKRVGGTTVVHSIKKHMWFLEAAAALLEGDEYTEAELAAQES